MMVPWAPRRSHSATNASVRAWVWKRVCGPLTRARWTCPSERRWETASRIAWALSMPTFEKGRSRRGPPTTTVGMASSRRTSSRGSSVTRLTSTIASTICPWPQRRYARISASWSGTTCRSSERPSPARVSSMPAMSSMKNGSRPSIRAGRARTSPTASALLVTTASLAVRAAWARAPRVTRSARDRTAGFSGGRRRRGGDRRRWLRNGPGSGEVVGGSEHERAGELGRGELGGGAHREGRARPGGQGDQGVVDAGHRVETVDQERHVARERPGTNLDAVAVVEWHDRRLERGGVEAERHVLDPGVHGPGAVELGDEHLAERVAGRADGVGQRDRRGGSCTHLRGQLSLRDRRPVEELTRQAHGAAPDLAGVIHDAEHVAVVAALNGDRPVGVGVAQRVPERLGALVAIDGRPGCHGPAVVELPDDGSGGPWPPRPVVLDRVGDSAGLVELCGPVPVGEVGGDSQVRRETAVELAVAVLGLLVQQEDGVLLGERRAVRIADRALEGCPRRWGLEPELGAEAWDLVAVDGVVDAVPHLPLVVRAVVDIVRVDDGERLAGGARAALDVRPGRVELGDDGREQLGVVTVSPRRAGQLLRPAPVHKAPEVLVAAVPQNQGRVRGQPRDGLAGLGLELAPERVLLRVGRAGEQEVLPDEDPLLVADVIEVVGLVDAAAPHAQQVEVRAERLVDAAGDAVARDPGEQMVIGDPVGPLGEDRATVDAEGERRADLVGLGVELHGAEADPPVPLVERRAARSGVDLVDRDVEVDEGLLTVPDGPPQRRVRQLEVDDRGDRSWLDDGLRHDVVAAEGR